MRWTMLCCSLVLVAPISEATTVSDELARCAAISSRDSRLACYDTLAHRAPDASPPIAAALPTPVQPASAIAAANSAPIASAVPSKQAAEDPKNFGLTALQRHVAIVGPKEESARIVSMAGNQAGHSTFVLDNGQMWAVLDGDGWLSNGDQVTIKRATLGSFLLTAPSHHTYRVHRIQ